MSAYVVARTVTLETVTCYKCGVIFGVPKEFDDARLRDHASWFCPSGHSQVYTGKTEEQKQRERAELLERRLANRDEDLRAERASHIATKGQLTKVRKRVANGVCPCCQRTFADVARHMAGQHPEFVEQVRS